MKEKNKTILLTSMALIWDYILWRNFIESVKKSEKYKWYRIVLAGNLIWKDLWEKFDSEFVDEFIWIDRNKFTRNAFYRFEICSQIYRIWAEVAIHANISIFDVFLSDTILRLSWAKEKIWWIEQSDNFKLSKFLLKNIYTKAINIEYKFEFIRNKEFFEQIINEKIFINKPTISKESIIDFAPTKDDYVVIFPGASSAERRWNNDNYIRVIRFILNRFSYKILIAWWNGEIISGEAISSAINSERIINLTWRTSLMELTSIISNSKLLISNETSAVHIGVAVWAKIICVSNWNTFVRFNPYPSEIYSDIVTIYPRLITDRILKGDLDWLLSELKYFSDININLIDIEEIENALLKKL